jgi:TonB family protein
MKKKSVLNAALILGVLAAPFALSAKSVEQAYIESFRGRTDIPVPVAVVKPSVSDRYAGAVVEVEFVVDVTGKPVDVSVRNPAPAPLADPVLAAIAQWKFAPARTTAGEPVAMKVRVPVRIVDDFVGGSALAMK